MRAQSRQLSTMYRGMTIIEVVAAAALLGVLLTTMVSTFRAFDNHRRTAERRGVALETTQALLEQLGNTSWDELTPAAAETLEVPAAVKSFLPGATVSATVEDVAEPVPAKRLTVELQWNSAAGATVGPARLTTWVYRHE